MPAVVTPRTEDGEALGAASNPGDPARPPNHPRARLFLALWPTPGLRNKLLAWRDAFDWPAGAALVAPDKLHLTLHFIGPVARERIDAVGAGIALATGSFELRFGRAELWPGGIVVLRPLASPDGLLALHRRLGEAVRALGLPTETRPYRPHVTVARKADGAALRFEPEPLRWRVRSHVLVESRPGRGGGYVVLRRYG